MRRRAPAPIATTFELVDAITAAIPAPARFGGGHPAKRTFQAIRIAVNDELDQLDDALPLAWELLRAGGRLAAISFHSLEDRRVKRFLADRARGCICPPDLPVCACGRTPEAELVFRRSVVADPGRGRPEPAREVRPPARGAQARSRRCLMPAATAAERHAARARDRPRRAPTLPRRVSGPIARPRAVPAPPRAGRPASSTASRRSPTTASSTASCAGALWICFVGVALMGIVAMQVSLLKLNSGISRAVETTATLERQNSDMEASIARLASGERIRGRRRQARHGHARRRRGALPARARRRSTPACAARRMRAPSDDAQALMANHGVVPGSLMAPAPVTAPTGTAPATAPPRAADHDRAAATAGHADADARSRDAGADTGRRPRSPPPTTPAAPTAPPPVDRVRLIERRIGLLFAVFLCMLGLAGLRATWLGVVKADTLRKVAATQQTAKVVVPARRGAITDRNGIELAVSQPATTVAATPYLIKDPQRVAAAGSPSRSASTRTTLLRQLTRRDTGFAYLAHQVPAIRARRVQRMKIEGLEFIPEARRTYPRDFLASQLIGSVGAEGSGLSGLEYSLDGQLRGRDGERRLTKDALGQAIELRETRREKPGARTSR